MRTDLLKKVEFFSSLDSIQLGAILKVAETRLFPKNTTLFHRGEPGDSLYVILSGRVKAILIGEDGREVTLAFLSAGEIVGEMALFDSGERRSATVLTVEPSELMMLTREQFMRAIAANPTIALSVMKTLARRLRETSKRVGDLIFLDTFSRLARYLVELAEKEGHPLADGSTLITRPTQEEIAHFIGASRETVNRVLKELENQGFIRLVRRKIIIYRVPQ